tara:strand:+ start:1144 stop:1401 length:258 start_codon:yes stop_codon:yes gene_type:complete
MALLPSSYQNTQSFFIETYINVKRVIRIQAFNEDHAIKRALAKEEDRVIWKNWDYEFVDCDCNVVKEKDYETYRSLNKGLRGKSY